MDQWPAMEERAHPDAVSEEWIFTWWSPDGSVGGVTGYRLVGRVNAWYWWALARAGAPLLHVTEFTIPRRADPMIAKADAMWAEFTCEAPFEQWTLGNETHGVLLDEADEALGRAYGDAVPMASDLEWYAVSPPAGLAPDDRGDPDDPDEAARIEGYRQDGVVHGVVELLAGDLEFEELPAHRLHRWSWAPMPAWRPEPVRAHLGLRAPFRFPDGACVDLVLTSTGWRTRLG